MLALLLAASISSMPDIALIQSREDSNVSYIIVNDCKMKVKTKDLKEKSDTIVELVMKYCLGDDNGR